MNISHWPILKSPNPSIAYSVRYHLHPCLNPLPSSHFSLPLGPVVRPPSDPGTICLSIFCQANRCQFLLGSSVIWSSLYGKMLAANLWNNHTAVHCRPKFVTILFSATELHPQPLFFFQNETHLLRVRPRFLYDPSFKYPCYYLYLCETITPIDVLASLWQSL
jgi:hypothetical protein